MTALLRVALIDDDPDIREIARFALVDLGGLTVRSWEDGRKFLAEYEDWRPQIVLLDLEMPGMDGWETMTALRARAAAAPPVVVMSGRPEIATADGIIGSIGKPFDPLSLADDLRALWLRHGEEEKR